MNIAFLKKTINNHLYKILAAFCAVAVAITIIGPAGQTEAKETKEITYDTLLLDNSYVHDVNIEISEEDWEDLKANPTMETKYHVNVTVDGEEFKNVQFKTKGNSSLSSVARSSSDRYSFKLNFGAFEDGQTYHGLKKLHLGNLFGDATYMKDYITYQIFHAINADAPLCSYTKLSINGELFGLYIAIEDISGSFLDRTHNGKGEIYKPDNGIDDMNGGNRDEGESEGDSRRDEAEGAEDGEADWEAFANGESADGESSGDREEREGNGESSGDREEWEEDGDSSGDREEWEGNGESSRDREEWEGNGESSGEREEGESEGESGGGWGGFGSGANLAYIDDNISSYSDIFDNAVTNVTEEDEQKVVDALKNLSEGNIEEAVDSDAVIRYFAAHNFVVNSDSYTGGMLHNYFLYERGGKLSMLPWDYNLAFGGFGGGDWGSGGGLTGSVNIGIDSLVNDNESRPMWDWIVENEEYLEKYHEVVDEMISGYFESGEFEAEMTRVYEMIRPLVENDPTAFYTVEEFDTAYNTLLKFCLLRAESYRKQLNGELATKTSQQNASDRVDASDISSSDMGSMNAGDDRDDSDGESAGDREESDGDSRRSQEAAEEAAPAENSEGTEAAESDSGESEAQEETEPDENAG